MNGDRWEHFAPEGCLGLRGVGSSKERAFEQVGLALTATMTDPASVRPQGREEIHCSAPDDERLLLAWIETLLGRMAMQHLLFGQYRVRIGPQGLHATALGEPLDPRGVDPRLDLHRVFCEQLRLIRGPAEDWRAEVILRPRGLAEADDVGS